MSGTGPRGKTLPTSQSTSDLASMGKRYVMLLGGACVDTLRLGGALSYSGPSKAEESNRSLVIIIGNSCSKCRLRKGHRSSHVHLLGDARWNAIRRHLKGDT